MSTFAQIILESDFFNDNPDSGSSYARRLVEVLPMLERLVFDRSIPDAIINMVLDGTTTSEFISQHARIPLDEFWAEWAPVGDVEGRMFRKVGVYVFPHLTGEHRLLLMGLTHPQDQGDIIVLAYGGLTDDMAFNFILNAAEHPNPDLIAQEDMPEFAPYMTKLIRRIVGQFMLCCFAMALPKVTKQMPVVFGPKLQRKREKAGKVPLVEYKQVDIDLSTVRPVYDYSPGTGEHGRHRLHSVMGHIRAYTKGRDKPLLKYIPPHWRGDPSLGVLLRERNVKITPKGNENAQLTSGSREGREERQTGETRGDNSVQQRDTGAPVDRGSDDGGDQGPQR